MIEPANQASVFGGEAIGTALLIAVSLVFVAGVLALTYFALPKKYRAQHLWYRFPIIVGPCQAGLGLLAIAKDFDFGGSICVKLYLLLNLSLMFVYGPEKLARILSIPCSVDMEPAAFVCFAVFFWMLIAFLVGMLVDRRRRRGPRVEASVRTG